MNVRKKTIIGSFECQLNPQKKKLKELGLTEIFPQKNHCLAI